MMSKNQIIEEFRKPLRLSANLFTPLLRTPWAGHYIGQHLKGELFPESKGKAIGESWEFSCDPDFPSELVDLNLDLASAIRQFPEETLSNCQGASVKDSCQILIKILHADQPLSVQVHPSDGDPALAPDECGKPESWLVLAANPGAGLYLGFSRSLSKQDIRAGFQNDGDGRSLLQFVPVKPGDFFDLGPGVPHAVGEGVCLLEPQRVISGQRGKTYRIWDWGRKYNDQGQIDYDCGKPRELHLDAALNILHPESQWGLQYVDSLRRFPQLDQQSFAKILTYPANDFYQVRVVEFSVSKPVRLAVSAGFLIGVPLAGRYAIRAKNHQQLAGHLGQTFFYPNMSFPCTILPESGTKIAFVSPPGIEVLFSQAEVCG